MVTTAAAPNVAVVSTKTELVPAQAARLVSVDILRGLVMVIMALDHTRDFLTYLRFAPEDMSHTYGALFFTRFITHYCAPVFAFLAGTGAFLATRGNRAERNVVGGGARFSSMLRPRREGPRVGSGRAPSTGTG